MEEGAVFFVVVAAMCWCTAAALQVSFFVCVGVHVWLFAPYETWHPKESNLRLTFVFIIWAPCISFYNKIDFWS